MTQVAAIVLTKNEERDLPACLESLEGVADELYVVDSGSTDRTVEIAHRFGAMVLEHEFVSHAAQLNWALENIRTGAEWFFRIDADERVSPELKESLRKRLPGLPPDVTGVLVPLRVQFLGKGLRWGGVYPVWLLRLWRRDAARCEDSWMDEHMLLGHGQARRISGDLIHVIPKSLSEWTRKHNWYAERECRDILDGVRRARDFEGQARVRKFLKQSVYLKLPLFHRAFLYWFYRYFLRLGFLDGKEGLVYHFLQALWYRFLVDAKLFEICRARLLPGAVLEREHRNRIAKDIGRAT